MASQNCLHSRSLPDCDHDQTVRDLDRFVRRQRVMLIALAPRRLAGVEVDSGRQCERRGHGVQQRDVDVLAATGAVAVAQCEQDAVHGVEAGQVIGDRHADPRRRAVPMAGDVHQPALALDDGVVARQVLLGADLSVAGDRAVDQPWIQRGDRLEAETEPGEAPRPEVLDQHVGRRDQAAEHGGAGVGLQVEGDALLAAVQAEEEGAPAVAGAAPRRACRPRASAPRS